MLTQMIWEPRTKINNVEYNQTKTSTNRSDKNIPELFGIVGLKWLS